MAETLTIRTASSTEVVKIAVPGPQGPAGQGLPTGGTTGQVLRKASGSDYDTEWAAAGSGSGSVTSVALASSDLTITGSPITSSGTITANIAANAVTLEKLQTISSEHLLGRHSSGNGGVQTIGLGTGLAISGSNVRVATTGITAGTYTKLTIDETGRATVGATATPQDIGAQGAFQYQSLTITGNVSLSSARAKYYEITTPSAVTAAISLPTGQIVGDRIIITSRNPWSAGSIINIEPIAGVYVAATISQINTSVEFIATSTTAGGWEQINPTIHTHAASDITSGTLAHERGGLEANVSAYNGLVKISGGSTSAVGIGTGSTEVAAGDHGHGNITSDGKLGSVSGLPVVTTTAGAVTTLALGTAGQVLTVNSGATGVEFAAASGGFDPASPDPIGTTTPNTGAFTSLSTAPAANTSALTTTGYSLTGSNAQSLVDLAGTWNTTGTPSAIKLNITDTASNASSNLFQLQVGGSQRFAVRKDGAVMLRGGLNTEGGLETSSSYFRIGISGTTYSWFIFNENFYALNRAINIGGVGGGTVGRISMNNTGSVQFNGSWLISDASTVLAQRDGTNAQESRLYATYTSDTNYQRMTIKSVKQTLSALSGASATTTGTFIPDGAVVVGVTTRVATALTGASGYEVGDGTDADRWGDITGTAIGTTSDNRDWTAGTIECFTAGGEITLTAKTSNFTAGAIEICAFYLAGEAD